ncbi:hypothetical protein FMEAI12_4020054 [Parafrankia sp. Ea1.12]|nr:hypothetical protein FMEAI12_4020054 [Parafrankia sp. Ea1.12]
MHPPLGHRTSWLRSHSGLSRSELDEQAFGVGAQRVAVEQTTGEKEFAALDPVDRRVQAQRHVDTGQRAEGDVHVHQPGEGPPRVGQHGQRLVEAGAIV